MPSCWVKAKPPLLGFRPERLQRWLVGLVALGVGAAVAFTGVIGFVGLLVPHLLRMGFGPEHRFLLPASALGGAILLVAADALARTVVAPGELPIGNRFTANDTTPIPRRSLLRCLLTK